MGRDYSEDRNYDADKSRHRYEKKYDLEHRSRRDDRSRRDRDEGHRNERRRRRSTDRDFEDERSRKKGRHSSKDRSSRRDAHDESKKSSEKLSDDLDKIPPAQKRTVDLLTSKTGGAYIPPAKLRLMQAEITDKSSPAYQRIAWEALKKSIHGYINKINTSNIGLIIRELLRENIIRGQGLLARSIIQAQAASPTFTPVYAALTAVINSKFAEIGELLIKRLVIQFKRGFRRNDKPLCISSGTFIAHLVNQQVVHELLILEILLLLVNNATDDSIEVAIAFLKECGMRLSEISRKGMESIFEILRNILHEGKLDKRVQYMIEVIFQVRKDGFKDYPAVPEELDLVEEQDQISHVIELTDPADGKDILNVFKFDPDFVQNEEKYQNLIKEILGSESEDEGDGNDDSSSEESSEAETETKEGDIIDNTETNLTALRRTIYLTINSSLDFEECAHKLMKMQLKPGQEVELCHMFLDCCAEMRTYEKFYGLLAGRFCAINKIYVTLFEQIFNHSYDTIHRLDTNKLRNVSKFFAHLLFTDAISWGVLSNIKLNEQDTTSSGRVFIKILFLELSEYMGLPKLNARVKDPTLVEAFQGLFPVDDPQKTRFSINFFTSIGLGGLTDDLREHLKSRPKPAPLPPVISQIIKSPSFESASETLSSSSSSSSSKSSDDSDSEEERKKRKKRNKSKKKQAYKERSAKIKKKESRDKSDKKSSKKSKKKTKKKTK